MRTFRTVALGATLLALLVGACSSGGSSPSPSAASAPPETSAPSEPAAGPHPAPAGPALSTTLKLGGPPECPERPFCLLGLNETYGLEFAEFVPLDAGGPLTVTALTGGQVDVGLLFTSDPAIATNGFVLLEDDKQLQLADNIVPVVRQEVLDANPGVTDLLNTVMERLTQEELTNLNKAVTVDARPAAEVATEWITAQNFDSISAGLEGDIIVGSTNFYEQEILGEIFARCSKPTARPWNASSSSATARSSSRPSRPARSMCSPSTRPRRSSSSTKAPDRRPRIPWRPPTRCARRSSKGLAALNPAAATDQNGFVVTQATADQYGLTTISDLAQPAPAP